MQTKHPIKITMKTKRKLEAEIYSAMYEIYSNPNNKDKYGQVGISNYTAFALKKRMSEAAFDYLDKGYSIYGKIQTYAAVFGLYKALNPTREFYQQTKTK
jgi:hypothetical protein